MGVQNTEPLVTDTAAPAPAPPPDPSVEPADEIDFSSMSIEDLSDAIEQSINKALDSRAPAEPAADPLEGVPEDVKPLAEKLQKQEAELAALKAKDEQREQAAREAETAKQVVAVAKEFKMTRAEVMAVAKYCDENPDKAAVLDFRTMAIVSNPELLKRAGQPAPPPPAAEPAAPSGGPAPANPVAVGSGGDAPPAWDNWKPGPGHGFGDITARALREQGGTFMTETP